MFRKYVIITLAAVLFMSTASCTSQKAEDDADIQAEVDSESAETADATEDNGDLSTSEGETEGGEESTEISDNELAPDEQLPSDDGGDKIADNTEVTTDDLSEEPAPAEESQPSEQVASNDTLSTTPEPTPEPATEPPPAETAMTSEPSATETQVATPEPEAESPKPVAASLKKVATQPWKVGKTLANAVYIVRDGDSVESISQKVFGSADKTKQLCRVNAFNCNRGIKVGDKMYYNSPQRPTDEAVVKTFYEDANIAPQMYTAKAGDNIRNLGKELLGHERSWMELWATNDVESKGDLEEGTQLRYWPSTEVAVLVQNLASAETATPPTDAAAMGSGGETAAPVDMGQAPPTQDLAAQTPPVAADPNAVPPPAEQAPAVGDPAAPPPLPQDVAANPPAAGEQQASSDLPPPPDQSAAAGTVEPPPPPAPAEEPKPATEVALTDDQDQTMILGVGAILLLAAAALFISIRKKRQRRAIDFNTTTQTQIE